MNYKEISANTLAAYRKARPNTHQFALARELGISRVRLHRLFSGAYSLKLPEYLKIMEVLKVPEDSLTPKEPKKPVPTTLLDTPLFKLVAQAVKILGRADLEDVEHFIKRKISFQESMTKYGYKLMKERHKNKDRTWDDNTPEPEPIEHPLGDNFEDRTKHLR